MHVCICIIKTRERVHACHCAPTSLCDHRASPKGGWLRHSWSASQRRGQPLVRVSSRKVFLWHVWVHVLLGGSSKWSIDWVIDWASQWVWCHRGEVRCMCVCKSCMHFMWERMGSWVVWVSEWLSDWVGGVNEYVCEWVSEWVRVRGSPTSPSPVYMFSRWSHCVPGRWVHVDSVLRRWCRWRTDMGGGYKKSSCPLWTYRRNLSPYWPRYGTPQSVLKVSIVIWKPVLPINITQLSCEW